MVGQSVTQVQELVQELGQEKSTQTLVSRVWILLSCQLAQLKWGTADLISVER